MIRFYWVARPGLRAVVSQGLFFFWLTPWWQQRIGLERPRDCDSGGDGNTTSMMI